MSEPRCRGTKHDDDLFGTPDKDVFKLSQGGRDTAYGGDGNDKFVMGMKLNANDSLVGGDGFDTVNLNGTLILSQLNGFIPAPSFLYDVVTYDTRTGTFATILGAYQGGGKQYKVDYVSDGVTLTVLTGVNGRKADGQIALGSGAFVGNNFYNLDGSGQTSQATPRK